MERTERTGQANEGPRETTGHIVCGFCGRSLAPVEWTYDSTELVGLDGLVSGPVRWAAIDQTVGDKMWNGQPLAAHDVREYRGQGARRERHRFECRSQVCRKATRNRGQISYLDELPEPGTTATTILPA